MHYLASEISELHGGMTSFFMHDHNQSKILEAFTGTNEIPVEEFRNALTSAWQLEVQSKFEGWRDIKIPTWSDKTFQEEEMEFVYPYYEGINQMGFAVVQFSHGFQEENCSKVEVLLEVCRGLYLDQYHETGKREAYQAKTSGGGNTKKEREKLGFFCKTIWEEIGMSDMETFFFIEIENLGDRELFPFHLYLYNSANKKYNPFIYANSPFNKEKRTFLEQSLEKGARLAISHKQKRTFLDDLELDPEDVIGLKSKPVHKLEKKRIEKLKAMNPDLDISEDPETGPLRSKIKLNDQPSACRTILKSVLIMMTLCQ